jgi:hypothetical protein
MTALEKGTLASKDSSKILLESERTRCSIYSRVMGYFQPTIMWNIGKKGEWEDRRSAFFVEPTLEEMDELALNRKGE